MASLLRQQRFDSFIEKTIVGTLFLLGFWLVALWPLGLDLSRIPGELGDPRLLMYILEHFYQWLTGQVPSYWDASYFYPFPETLAFSDHLLGSAPFYAIFRLLRFDRETAFQLWYLLGYVLNFAAAAWVLSRLRLKPLAVGVGAFFFAFGLPILAQEGHAQLLYRFGIPIACYLLWRIAQAPRLSMLLLLVGWTVWQFFLSIYLGVFLSGLLLALLVLLPFGFPPVSVRKWLVFWPERLWQAWKCASVLERIFVCLGTAALLAGLAAMLAPYRHVTQLYGFRREWSEISRMLPRPRSFLLADSSYLWRNMSGYFGSFVLRHEHQLFPGLAVVILTLIGLVARFKTEVRNFAFLCLIGLMLLVVATISIGGYSFYWFIWELPGVNSIRAVSRIMLVLMWPLALFSAYCVDALLRGKGRVLHYNSILIAVLVTMLISESVAFQHLTFSKAEHFQRLMGLQAQLPATLPENPILFLAMQKEEPDYVTEIDAMLLSQDLGWPTLNGYSGNFPPEYQSPERCVQLPRRIASYLSFSGNTEPSRYFELINRVVPIGFMDCDPIWWQKVHAITRFSGSVPAEVLQGLELTVKALTKTGNQLTVEIEILNGSTELLPARSATGNPIRILVQTVDMRNGQYLESYENRIDLDFDVPAGERGTVRTFLEMPNLAGQYQIELMPVQEGLENERYAALDMARSAQTIVVAEDGSFTITD